jgi:4,5-DOPA dioxygenase extradiol
MNAATTPTPRCPVLFVSHGAAFFTTSRSDPTHHFLAGFADTVARWRPAGIVVVSAHFMETPVRITGPGPLETIHDHPAQSVYDVRYPGHGTEALTALVRDALANAGVPSRVDAQRGLDHGAWVPLWLLRPQGDLPVIQLSIDARQSPRDHVALGAALAPLREAGILVLGSGGVTHNQSVFRRGFFGKADPAAPETFSREFDAWISSLVTSCRGQARAEALAAFQEHPLARLSHPTIEHFLPLLVTAGAAGEDPGFKVFEGFQHSLSTTAFQLGETA